METYIQISQLNDFIFCPKSIYFHNLYARFDTSLYHDTPQIEGRLNHENIDAGTYSSAKRYLQGLRVYSEQYRLCGQIDIYDRQEKALIERKTKIWKIYDGYRYQLYGQYFAMREMGYEVTKLFLHSLKDNKRYPVDLPAANALLEFNVLLSRMHIFRVTQSGFVANPEKCARCIYRELCDSCAPEVREWERSALSEESGVRLVKVGSH